MRINLQIPDSLAEKMLKAIEKEEDRIGLKIATTSWICRAISRAVALEENPPEK